MDSKTEELLDKYWAAETSLDEEQELRALLEQQAGTEEDDELKGLFAHFSEQKEVELDASFDEEVLAMIEAEPETKVISMADYFRRYASIAAAVLVLITSSYLFIQNQNSYQADDTFDDPQLALEEVKKQLLTVSMYMNRGNEQIQEIANLGKADIGLQDMSQLNKASQSLEPLNRMSIRR